MNKWLLTIVLLIPSIISFGQTVVSGTVTEKEELYELIGCTVTIKSTGMGTATDYEGRYNLSLDKGTYTIIFSYVGYKTLEKIIEVDGTTPLTLDVVLESSVIMDETIIVTDGKYEKRQEESTVSIDVIGADALESNNLTSLDEIVKKASGVNITDGQISIRGGAGYAYGVGSRVIFLVDGQPLLSAELSDVKWNFMPIENAEQIEIIKGSASVLYGSGALNGVVNLRTAYPKGNDPYTAISLYAGIYDQPKIDSMRWFNDKSSISAMPMFSGLYFAHRQRLFKNFDLVLGGNIHLKNGYRQGENERRFRFNFNTKYRDPKSEGRIAYGLNGNIMYHEIGLFFMSKDMKSNPFINITSISRDRYLSLNLDPYITIFDKKDNQHNIKGRWFRIEKLRDAPSSIADLFSLEYQFQRTFPKKWVLTAGAMGQYLHVNSILFAPLNGSWKDRSLFTAGSGAAYTQLDKKFWDRLAVTLGLRWEGFAVDSSFTPALPIFRAGMNFEASPNDFLRLSFGQGFRFPSMAERFFNEKLPGTPFGIYPNPDLLPETGWSTELAYRRTFKGKNFNIYADVAFFWMEYDNMVEFALGSHPQGPGFTFVNISKARIAGWEISTQGEFLFGKIPLRVWGGYTYSFPGDLSSDTSRMRNVGHFLSKMTDVFANGVDRSKDLNNILKYRRLHTLRFDVETELWGLTIGTALNYNSFMQRVDILFELDLISPGVGNFRSIHNQGYWVWDLRLGYKFNNKQRINLVIQNLLNEEYAVRPANMGQPRTFSLKYSHIF